MQRYHDTTYIVSGNMGGHITGGTIDIGAMKTVSFVCDSSAATSPDGHLRIQVSNDNSVWAESGTNVELTGTATKSVVNGTDIGSRYVRLYFDRDSGSGANLNVAVHAC